MMPQREATLINFFFLLLLALSDALQIPGDQTRVQIREASARADNSRHNPREHHTHHAHRGHTIGHSQYPKNNTDLMVTPAFFDQPTGRPSKTATAAEMTGVDQNAAGDLAAFLDALLTNVGLIIAFFLVASFLRQRYPQVYSSQSEEGPEEEPKRWERLCGRQTDPSFFGWWKMSAEVSIDEVIKKRGLDIGMLLQFSEDAMKILFVVGLPLLLFLSPQHAFLGGYRAGNDYLSYQGMANVVDGHPYLYWEHAVICWLIVIVVQYMIFTRMRYFQRLRMDWLKGMPDPRATTVLVEGIPASKRNDDDLKAHMDKLFGGDGAVKDAFVVKDTIQLLKLVRTRDAEEDAVSQAEFKLKEMEEPTQASTASDTAATQKAGEDEIRKQRETVEKAQAKLEKAQQAVEEERERVLNDAKDKELGRKVNLSVAFVTFASRRDAELAKYAAITTEREEWVVSNPPDPADVIYTDLQADPHVQQVRDLLGYAAIAGVFWAYLPCVVGIAYYASLETLSAKSDFFKQAAQDPSFVALWDGLVCALALQLFMSFVPTFFVFIFSTFFVLKAQAWLQFRIQGYYFYFQVVFVLLVTAVGSSIVATLKDLGDDPGSVFYLLASSMPTTSHFYLNFLPLQWASHAQNLLRIANLFKFKAWSLIVGEEKGKEKSEPEDQDYYGIGSRSARFTFMLVVALTFCSLSPLITVVGWVNFWMCRKVYGYLCVYAEECKADLGGVFYVSQLKHVQEGLFIYIILMSGVLTMRDATWTPGAIAGGALVFQVLSYRKFCTQMEWESLCLEDLVDHVKDNEQEAANKPIYMQPELLDESLVVGARRTSNIDIASRLLAPKIM